MSDSNSSNNLHNDAAIGSGKDEDGSGDVAADSSCSTITSPQFRRNNPYATSPAQSLHLDDGGAAPFMTNVPSAASGGVRSPPPVNVVLHTSSTVVSRTTSMVKGGDARISRTTSMKTSDNSLLYSPQLPHCGSSLPGSEEVSRTTSMSKRNTSMVFSMQPLRFTLSQPGSTRVSRTTSMVKGGNPSTDSVPTLSPPLSLPPPQQPQPQQPQQPQGTAMSPLLDISPHSAQLSSFSHSTFSMRDTDASTMSTRRPGSGGQFCDVDGGAGGDGGGGVVGGAMSSPALLHYYPFRFNASATGEMMPPYSRAELYSNEPTDFEGGGYEENLRMQEQAAETQEVRHPYFTPHPLPRYPPDSPPQQQLQQPQRPYYTAERPFGYQAPRPPSGQQEAIEAGRATPLFSGSAGYTDASLPSTLHAVCEPTREAYELQRGMDVARETPQALKVPAARETSPVRTTQQPMEQRRQSSSSTDYKTSRSKQRKQRSSPPSYQNAGAGKSVGEAEDAQQVYTDQAPNPLLTTQPPRPSATQEHDASSPDTSAPPDPAAVATGGPGFTAGELTTMLEAAIRSFHAGDPIEELWCPGGAQLSVYDAGMKEHYSIPSEEVALTRGAVKYVSLFARYGNQTRFRFQLCNRYLHHRCTSGLECQYIHSHVLSKSTQVHLNENGITASGVREMNTAELAGGHNFLGYPTMERGMVFAVFPPNQLNSAPQLIPSEMILVTEGALQTYRTLSAEAEGEGRTSARQQQQQPPAAVTGNGNGGGGSGRCLTNANGVDAPIIRPRHCAHFQFKRMCNLGAACHFIHTLIPFVQGMVNQPPLPCAVNVAALDDRTAGFVLPQLLPPPAQSDGGGGDRQGRGTPAPARRNSAMQCHMGSSNNPSTSMATTAMAPVVSSASTTTPLPWSQPALYQTGSSLISVVDASTPMGAVFAASYSQNVPGEMPTTAGSSTAVYDAAPTPTAYPGWGTSYTENTSLYAAPVTAVAPFGVAGDRPPSVAEQQHRVVMANGVCGLPSAAPFTPQGYTTYGNASVSSPPPPRPSMQQQCF